MTNVSIESRGPVHEIKLTGHAAWDETGHDIVCSAISMLTYTLASYITKMEEAGDLQAMTIELQPGDVYIRAVANEDYFDQEKLRVIVDMIRTGFKLLAEKYPLNVQFVPHGGEKACKAE